MVGGGAVSERDGRPGPVVTYGLAAVVGAGVAGLVLHALAAEHGLRAVGGGLVVAGTFAVGGGLLGFLFGIPKLLTSGAAANPDDRSATSTAGYAPNTNLEQVSDWLTKILLGAGLTQIGTLPHRLRVLGDALAPTVGGGPGAAGFAAAVSVYFTVLGFLGGWLVTRLLLARALSAADRQTLADSVNQTVLAAGSLNFSPQQVRDLFDTGVEGLRVQALALLQGKPDPENADLVVSAIDRHLSPFELLQALLAARAMAGQAGLPGEQRAALHAAVAYKLRNTRTVPPYSRRRSVAEEVLRLLPAPETAPRAASGATPGATAGPDALQVPAAPGPATVPAQVQAPAPGPKP